MALDYSKLKSWPFQDIIQNYDWKDCALYSLGIGIGKEPTNAHELRYVYEKNMVAFPSMAVVLANPGFWVKDPATGIDWLNVMHVEQRLNLLQPLPTQCSVIGRTRVTAIVDKGPGKGALLISERDLINADGDQLMATVTSVSLLRGDGGFTTSCASVDQGLPALPSTPDRAADQILELPTSREAALLYRLNGDFNPLHADPEVARKAGFERPILHGLCSYGIAARAVVSMCCGDDEKKLAQFSVRFSAPVYPGETLRTEIWHSGEDVQFRCAVVERNVVVLSHGLAKIHR